MTVGEFGLEGNALRQWMEGMGYRLLPPAHPWSPGASGLVVAMREVPTGEHYDPEEIELRLRDLWGMADWQELTITAAWLPSDHVCPGRVLLSDRTGKRVEFFAYGGTLAMHEYPRETIYVIRSPAPVLSVAPLFETWCDEVASHTESRIAEAAADWSGDEEGFLRRLAAVAPLETYAAAVHSILVEHAGAPSVGRFYREVDVILRRERRWLKAEGHWPESPVKIETLLGPGSADA
jgi:hypothetical protein